MFTGLALVEDPETGEVERQPVRLSLQRTNVPGVKKWITLKQTKLRNKAFWDKTFVLGTYKKPFDRGVAHLITVGLGRDTTDEERMEAFELFQAVQGGQVEDVGSAAPDAPAEPDAKGGLAV